MIGIPLMLLYLTRMGDLLARIFKSLYCGMFRRKKRIGSVLDDTSRYDEVPQMQCPLADGGPGTKIYTTPDQLITDPCRGADLLQERQHIASIHRPAVPCLRLQTLPQEDQARPQTGFKRNGDLVLSADCSSGNNGPENDRQLTVQLLITVFIVLAYLFSGATMFYYLQNWSYVDAIYFCFTSLTTIGFGNLDPGDDVGQVATDIKIVLCYIYLTLGMAIIAMCFNIMQEVILKKNKVEGRICNVQPNDRPDIYC